MAVIPLWRRVPEVGTVLGIRFVLALATLAGRSVATGFLWLLALYYAVLSARTRRASRGYLARVGERPSFANVVKHIHTFARVGLDRLFFLRGQFDAFAIDPRGRAALLELGQRTTGAILLGAHFGSFEAMRADARRAGAKLAIVVDTRSAERLARVLARVSGDANLNVIPVDPQGVGTAIRVRDAVKDGQVVGILADRTVDQRNVTVDFLGSPASFPAGPFVLAHTLRCQVYVVFGVFQPPNRYVLHCELFAESIKLDRARRADALQSYAQQYADRLAEMARSAPYNWFNFYDFWA